MSSVMNIVDIGKTGLHRVVEDKRGNRKGKKGASPSDAPGLSSPGFTVSSSRLLRWEMDR